MRSESLHLVRGHCFLRIERTPSLAASSDLCVLGPCPSAGLKPSSWGASPSSFHPMPAAGQASEARFPELPIGISTGDSRCYFYHSDSIQGLGDLASLCTVGSPRWRTLVLPSSPLKSFSALACRVFSQLPISRCIIVSSPNQAISLGAPRLFLLRAMASGCDETITWYSSLRLSL